MGRRGGCAARIDGRHALDVELEVHDVAVLHDVVLALLAQAARRTAAGLAAKAHVVVERGRLGLDEAALEVGMDDAGGLRRLHARVSVSPLVK